NPERVLSHEGFNSEYHGVFHVSFRSSAPFQHILQKKNDTYSNPLNLRSALSTPVRSGHDG
ncbi:TPA: hypothetical protein ACH748_005460, partial [Escherichia coli]